MSAGNPPALAPTAPGPAAGTIPAASAAAAPAPSRGTVLAHCSNPALVAHLAAIVSLPLERLPLGPDSQHRPQVAHGRITEHRWSSQVFAGTVRRLWLYQPAGAPAGPMRSMIFQDGWKYLDPEGQARAANVLDNLIAQGDLPPMAAIFIDPGEIPVAGGTPVSNRSREYDTVSGEYARLLAEEILPFAQERLPLATEASARAICGVSSGGICAFLAAWHRPDLFSKVLSHVGSFADIRGGHVVPSLVRNHSRRPLRVLLQGCVHDLDRDWGNWWLANLQMEAALAFAGYEYAVAWSAGNHALENGGAILPDCLRWLWRP